MRTPSKVRYAALAMAVAVPALGAFTPTKLVAATDRTAPSTAQPPIVQPYFFSHILAITDVLHNCGGGAGQIVCPVLAPKQGSNGLW